MPQPPDSGAGGPGGTANQVPQSVLGPLTEAALFLVLAVRPGGEAVVRELLADVSGLTRSVGFRAIESGLSCVVGIGSAAWDRLFGAADVVDETHGFRYFDQRDLLGFVDGTENPTGTEATEAVTVGAEDPDFAGGSYVIVQKYLHDVAAWQRLPVEEQERVIGRTKLEDVELPDGVQPTNSHVALNTIVDEDGTERQILRDNMPFGSIGGGEYGTYFIGYARTPDITERMLRRMFLGDPPGNTDRILDFSTAVTGGLFFVPTVDFLDDPPDPTATGATAATGELGIGDLKGRPQ
jgi:putative iron-dependent peroxidase